MQRKRDINSLNKIKSERILCEILVPNHSETQRYDVISDKWREILRIDRAKVIDFILNDSRNSISNNDKYDYIPIPIHLLSLIESSPNKIHKTLIIKNVNQFTETSSGTEFKTKRIKIASFEFMLHLYPNGLTQINDGFVGYFVELTKKPNDIKYIAIYIDLYCIQTNTKHKRTLILRDIGDSEGWIWSLSIKQCKQHNILQFGAALEILQIVFKNSLQCTEHYISSDLMIKKGMIFEYEWKENEVKHILNEIKQCKNKQKLSFWSKNTKNNIFCFEIQYEKKENNKDNIYIHCKLLRLPIYLKGIEILFEFNMGYPQYRNTVKMDYKESECKLKLIEDDIQWLLCDDDDQIQFKISIEIIEEIQRAKRHKLIKCWHEMNECLSIYYSNYKQELGNRFLEYVERMQFNECLISQIVEENDEKNEINWKWHLLYEFEEDIDSFPISQSIVPFHHIIQKQQFISYLFSYFYLYKDQPSFVELLNAANCIKHKNTDQSQQKEKELEQIIEKETKEDEILITKVKKQWFILSEIGLEKDNLLADIVNIEERINELELKRSALKRKQKELDHKENDVHSVINDIKKQREDSALKRKEFQQKMEEMKEEKQQNVYPMLSYNHHQIRNEIQIKSKIKDELKAFINTKNADTDDHDHRRNINDETIHNEHMDAFDGNFDNTEHSIPSDHTPLQGCDVSNDPFNKHIAIGEIETQIIQSIPSTIDIKSDDKEHHEIETVESDVSNESHNINHITQVDNNKQIDHDLFDDIKSEHHTEANKIDVELNMNPDHVSSRGTEDITQVDNKDKQNSPDLIGELSYIDDNVSNDLDIEVSDNIESMHENEVVMQMNRFEKTHSLSIPCTDDTNDTTVESIVLIQETEDTISGPPEYGEMSMDENGKNCALNIKQDLKVNALESKNTIPIAHHKGNDSEYEHTKDALSERDALSENKYDNHGVIKLKLSDTNQPSSLLNYFGLYRTDAEPNGTNTMEMKQNLKINADKSDNTTINTTSSIPFVSHFVDADSSEYDLHTQHDQHVQDPTLTLPKLDDSKLENIQKHRETVINTEENVERFSFYNFLPDFNNLAGCRKSNTQRTVDVAPEMLSENDKAKDVTMDSERSTFIQSTEDGTIQHDINNDDNYQSYFHDLSVDDHPSLPPQITPLDDVSGYEQMSINYDRINKELQYINNIHPETPNEDDETKDVTIDTGKSTDNCSVKYDKDDHFETYPDLKSFHDLVANDHRFSLPQINVNAIHNLYQYAMHSMSYAFPDNEPDLNLTDLKANIKTSQDLTSAIVTSFRSMSRFILSDHEPPPDTNPLILLRSGLELRLKKYEANVAKMINDCDQKSNGFLQLKKVCVVEFIGDVLEYLQKLEQYQQIYGHVKKSQDVSGCGTAQFMILRTLSELRNHRKKYQRLRNLIVNHDAMLKTASHEVLNSYVSMCEKNDSFIDNMYSTLIEDYTVLKDKYEWSDEEKNTLCDPWITMEEKQMEQHKVLVTALLIQIQDGKNKQCVKHIVESIVRGTTNENIKELIKADSFMIPDLAKFCNSKAGIRYSKSKVEIEEFVFRLYLYPNGSDSNKTKGCVQFAITLKTMPSNVKSVVIYCKLFEKTTNAEYHRTLIFDSTTKLLSWPPKLLSLQSCKKQNELEFGYIIQILQIRTEDGTVTDHAKNQLIGDALNVNAYCTSWNWKMDKHLIDQIQKNRIFYNENPLKNEMYISLAESNTNKKQINISLNIFKLPPFVEKLEASFEVNTNSKDLQMKKKQEFFVDYNSTQCTIELNRKQSEKIKGLIKAHHHNRIGDFTLVFAYHINKVYFRGYTGYPHTLLSVTDVSSLLKTVSKESTSPKKQKSIKHGKNNKRGTRNHKQRKRNKKQRH